jgi:hypothetical protein
VTREMGLPELPQTTGTCPVCGRSMRLTLDGRVYRHGWNHEMVGTGLRSLDSGRITYKQTYRACAGSGRKAVAKEDGK